MPELPEVETVRRGLAPLMEGRVIERAEARRPDLRWPLPERMAERLTGARVERLRRRSKYILADLSTGETLLIHLGMSGRMLISGVAVGEFHHPQAVAGKHDHVILDMAGGARITFNDARRFGAMDLMPTGREADHWLLKGLGPEPFGNDFHEDYLVARLAGRQMPAKAALLDQRIVAGLGNIYVCEVLHRACCTAPASIPAARRAGSVRHVWPRSCRSSGRFCPRRSRRADRPCATTGRPTANWAISSTPSGSTTARASPARNPAAPARSGGSCNRAGQASIAPPARDDLIQRATLRRSRPRFAKGCHHGL